jgi:hypothetical protein
MMIGDELTFELVLACRHFESVLRLVDDDTRQSNEAWVLTLFDCGSGK